MCKIIEDSGHPLPAYPKTREREREREKLERNIALVFAYSNVLNLKESGTLALVFEIVLLIFG